MENRTKPVSNEKNLGKRLRKKVLGGYYLHPTLYPLTFTPSLSPPPNMLLLELLQNTECKADVEREARLSLTSLLVLERTRDFYLSSSELSTDRKLSESQRYT